VEAERATEPDAKKQKGEEKGEDAVKLRDEAKTLRAAIKIMQRNYLFSNWKQYFQEPLSVKLGVCSPKEAKTFMKARHLTAFVSLGLHLFQINSEARTYFKDLGNFYIYRHDCYSTSQ